MAKTPFLLFISGMVGVIMNPIMLSATDHVSVMGLDTSSVVETVILPEKPEEKPVEVVTAAPQPIVKAPVAGTASVPVAAPKNYTVTIVTGEIAGGNLSYSDIYRTGKFIYGHNSAALLGNLASLNIGEIFTVTEGGVTRSYRVADKVVYEKAANGYLNGSYNLTYQVEINANGHSLSLMTCTGTPLPGGDATHRLVVFADAV